MNPIVIRAAEIEDLPTLKQFEQGVVEAERPYNAMLKDGPVSYYDIAGLIESDDSMLLVAERSGELVASGYAALRTSLDYLRHDKHAYLGFMYVDPTVRGQGVILQILDGLKSWAQHHGAKDYYLDVYAGNASAIRAYEKCGFRPNLIEMKLHE